MQKAIMCVDPDKEVLTKLEQVIGDNFGHVYVIETATDPKEAIRVINTLTDMGVGTVVLITSYLLGDMNGLQFIREVKKICPKIKTIFFSENIDIQMIEEAVNSEDVFRFVRKNYDPYEMAKVIADGISAHIGETELDNLYIELKQSENEKNMILESIAEGLLFIDDKYNILWMNEIARHEFHNGNLATKCYELLYGRKKPCADCESMNIHSGIRYHSLEKKFEDGCYKNIRYYPVLDDAGKTLGVLMSITDITNRKRLETMNYVLLEVAKSVNSAESTVQLYQNIYEVISKELSAQYMCVAGRDYDSVFIEYVNGKDKLIGIKKPNIKDHERVLELMSLLSKQMQSDENNNFVVIEGIANVEFVIDLSYRVVFFEFARDLMSVDILFKFIKSLSEQIKTGLTKMDSIKKFIYQANHDAMTSLYNKDFFMKTVNAKIFSQRENEHSHKSYALAIIDLNFFKEVNDTYGHIHGDEVLFSIAQRLLKSIRHGDYVARIGGDEFGILVEYHTKSEVMKAIDRVQESIGKTIKLGKINVNVGSSIGVVYDISNYSHAELAVKDADVAMYEAKKHKEGIGTYRIFEKDIQEKLNQQVVMENSLSKEILEKEFSMRYQPIISLATFETVGFEAFIRWVSVGGIIYNPNEFIAIAEDSGNIEKIGNFVLDHVSQAVEILCVAFGDDSYISINFSAKQLLSTQQLDKIEKVGLNKQRIQVEVTEKALVSNYDRANKNLEKLQDMGIKIHLDDFGTGFSSISHLNKMDINDIKIDSTLVQQLPYNLDCVKVVKAIISVAKNLGITITAEGVENAEQLKLLMEMGCDFAQGYYIGLPLTQAEAFLYKKKNFSKKLLEKLKMKQNQLEDESPLTT